jgi:hypothetical protein
MNNKESSSIERSIADALGVAGKEALNYASSRFPSYLRVFGNFFSSHAVKSRWAAAQLLAVCCVGFPMAQSSVAFV